MGGKHSIPLPRYGFCIRPQNPHRCRENHARVGSDRKRKSRSSQSELVPPPSADASFIGDPTTYGLLDINAATAEELMTLPGINRPTATSIIDYRRQIGFFRKIEDMALVPGVGATRFGHVRAEICVGDIDVFFVSSSLVRSGSSATSSGIDVSLTPADNESREFYGGDGVLSFGGRIFGRSSVTDSFSRGSPPVAFSIADDSDRVSRTEKNLTADVLDDVTAGLLRHVTKTCTPVLVADSGRLDESDEVRPLRVATWNVFPCSPEKADNVDFRQVFSRTLLENRCVPFVFGVSHSLHDFRTVTLRNGLTRWLTHQKRSYNLLHFPLSTPDLWNSELKSTILGEYISMRYLVHWSSKIFCKLFATNQ